MIDTATLWLMGITSIWLVIVSLWITTKSFRSLLLFKATPLILGVLMLVKVAVVAGWTL